MLLYCNIHRFSKLFYSINNTPFGWQQRNKEENMPAAANCETIFKHLNKNKPKLHFEYCECGCHGSSCVVAGREFSIYGVYNEKISDITKWILYAGHASCLSKIIGEFKSFELASLEAEKIIKKDLKEMKQKLQLELDNLAKLEE